MLDNLGSEMNPESAGVGPGVMLRLMRRIASFLYRIHMLFVFRLQTRKEFIRLVFSQEMLAIDLA